MPSLRHFGHESHVDKTCSRRRKLSLPIYPEKSSHNAFLHLELMLRLSDETCIFLCTKYMIGYVTYNHRPLWLLQIIAKHCEGTVQLLHQCSSCRVSSMYPHSYSKLTVATAVSLTNLDVYRYLRSFFFFLF